MSKIFKLGASAALITGLAIASAAIAADPHGGGYSGGGGVHGGGHSMPSRGFSGAPHGFHGTLPRASGGPARMHGQIGRAGHDLGQFRGHDFAHFTADERAAWQGGAWRHAWHHGHYGWWWLVGDDWFFYPAPLYPYPLYVGSDDYYDYMDEYGPPAYYWYYCENPAGYYPYVQNCSGEWQAVPPSPDAQ